MQHNKKDEPYGDGDTKTPVSRRALLGTIGIASVSLAGCMNMNGGNGGNGTDGNETGNDTDGNTTDDGGGGGNEAASLSAVRTDYGELIDDFQDGGTWFTFDGSGATLTPDGEQAVVGDHSLLIESDSSPVIIGRASGTGGLDLSDRYLSMAVKVETPLDGDLQLDVRETSNDHVTSTRVLPGGIDDWFRIDFGYTLGYGDIDFSNVQEIRFQVRGPDDGPVRLWIDDLRAGPARDESNVILAFYGGLESHYNTVFPILQERGWPAVAAVSRDLLNRSGRLSMDQLREMRDAGWEVCSYPQHAGDLTELSAREQRRVIESNRDYLANRGFERGSRHFFTPYNAMNTDTLEILRETHETGFVFGACSSGIPPTGSHTISAINGSDYESSRAPILRADIHNQVVVPYFEQVGGDGMSVEDFEAQLDRIETNSYGNGLVPITPSQLLEYY